MAFLSSLGFFIAALGAGGSYLRVFSALFGAELVIGGFAVAGLAAIIRIITAVFLKKPGPWLPIPLGLVSAGAVGYFFFLANQYPLSDLTSNPKNPPLFLHPVAKIHVGAGIENLDASFYLQRPYLPELANLQLQRYPAINSVKFKFPLEEAFPLLEKVLRERYPDWRVTLKNEKTFHLEAEVESTPFHFIDDVVIELRQGTQENLLDFRSRGRITQTDLGMNAKRLYDMHSVFTFTFNKRQEEWDRLQKAAAPVTTVQSTVPSSATPATASPAAPIATPAPDTNKAPVTPSHPPNTNAGKVK